MTTEAQFQQWQQYDARERAAVDVGRMLAGAAAGDSAPLVGVATSVPVQTYSPVDGAPIPADDPVVDRDELCLQQHPDEPGRVCIRAKGHDAGDKRARLVDVISRHLGSGPYLDDTTGAVKVACTCGAVTTGPARAGHIADAVLAAEVKPLPDTRPRPAPPRPGRSYREDAWSWDGNGS